MHSYALNTDAQITVAAYLPTGAYRTFAELPALMTLCYRDQEILAGIPPTFYFILLPPPVRPDEPVRMR